MRIRRLRQPPMRPGRLEDRDRFIDLLDDPGLGLVALGHVVEVEPADPGRYLERTISQTLSVGHRSLERCIGPAEVADLRHRLAGFDGKDRTERRAIGQQGRGAAEQVRRGRHIASGEGTPTGRGQALGGTYPERHAVVIERTELREVPPRLLEVVAE